ncbi:MAG TPA: sigma-70 family RNA polymerase sigma factor [Nannocystis exedens]|nr:sigma-70 family RNA polymerase sigma factor [Nannocystis exedens]
MNARLPADLVTLIEEQSDKLARFFRSSGVPYADAQDLTQQSFEILFGKELSTIDNPKKYLWGIARRKLSHFYQRTRQHSEFRSSQILPQGITSPSQRLDRRVRVQMLLQRLDDEERTAFLMRCEGLTLPEIAEAMELSLATIKRRLAEARKHIEAIATEERAPGEEDMLTPEDVEDSYHRD